MKRIKNKKGFISESVVLLFCFVIFIIVGFVFFILFYFVPKVGISLGSDFQALDGTFMLSNYLRTPVEVNGKKMNMADLIGFYYMEGDSTKKAEYRSKIDEITMPFLNEREYCYNNGIVDLIRGFMIFVTDDPPEDFQGSLIKTSRKFRSKNVYDNGPKLVIPQSVPLANGKVIYVLWVETAINGESVC